MRLYPVGQELKLLLNHFEAIANRRLSPLGLTAAQAQLLIILNNSTDTLMPQKKLEAAVGSSQSTVAGIVSRLAAKNLVTATRDGEDRRIKLVAITPEGIDCCDSAFAALKEAESELLSGLSDKDSTEFRRILKKLVSSDQSQAIDKI